MRRGEMEFLGWGAVLDASGSECERDLGVRAECGQRRERGCAGKASGLGFVDDEHIDPFEGVRADLRAKGRGV